MTKRELFFLRVGFAFALSDVIREVAASGNPDILRDLSYLEMLLKQEKIPSTTRIYKDRFARFCDDVRLLGEDREELRRAVFRNE